MLGPAAFIAHCFQFDTDRDAAVPGQDTNRCPNRGKQAEIGSSIESDGGDGGVWQQTARKFTSASTAAEEPVYA